MFKGNLVPSRSYVRLYGRTARGITAAALLLWGEAIRWGFAAAATGLCIGKWSTNRANHKKVVARTTLKNIAREVLHKTSLGTPSKHENNSFFSEH